MPTSLNLLDLFSSDPGGFGASQTLDMTQPAFANTLAAYKTTHQQALIGFLSDIANSSINKDEFYNRMIFSYLTTILEAGLTPDPSNWTQQVDAIKSFAVKATLYDSTKTYKKGDRVQNGFGGAWYEAVQDVTAGTAIGNQIYWQPASNFKIFNSADLLTTGRNLTSNDINKHLVFNGSSNQTFTLPLANSVPSGSMIFVRGRRDFTASFTRAGSDFINVDAGTGKTICRCFSTESIILVSNGEDDWRLTKINPIHSTFTTFSPVFGSSFNNATIYTNNSGFSQKISSRLYYPNTGTTIFIAIDSNTIIDHILEGAPNTANFSFEVPSGSTYRFWLSAAATFNNNSTTVQSVTI